MSFAMQPGASANDNARNEFGLPDDRMALLAARRAFVEMKHCFMRAVADIEGSMGERLQRRVRQSSEPMELWNLRNAVFAALPANQPWAIAHRIELSRQLDMMFPDSLPNIPFMPL